MKSRITKLLISSFTTLLLPMQSIKADDISSKTINILMPAPFADSTSYLINEYNTKHKNHKKIKVTRGPLETEAMSDLAISSLLLGNSPYDIVLIDVTWLPKYAKAQWISDLSLWFTKEEAKALASGAKLGNYFEGKLYRWPLVADMGLLYWRKDLMDKPPKTPRELIKISKNLQEKGKVKYGYVWQGRQYEGLSCVFLEVINGFGGNWIDHKGEPNLNTKNSYKAVSWLKELITEGISPKSVTNFSEPEALQIFESGEAAFMRNWPYAWAELNKDKSKVKGKVGVTVMVAENNNLATATLGSWGFSILSSSKNKLESSTVIKYLTSSSSQNYLFKKYGYTPTNTDVLKDKVLTIKYPILSSLEKGLSVAKPRPQSPLYAQMSDILQRSLSSILTNKSSIDEEMNRANKSTKDIILSAGK